MTQAVSEQMTDARPPLKVSGLFAGIGGIEVGLHRTEHPTVEFCEIDEGARRVLEVRFPQVSAQRCLMATL